MRRGTGDNYRQVRHRSVMKVKGSRRGEEGLRQGGQDKKEELSDNQLHYNTSM